MRAGGEEHESTSEGVTKAIKIVMKFRDEHRVHTLYKGEKSNGACIIGECQIG